MGVYGVLRAHVYKAITNQKLRISYIEVVGEWLEMEGGRENVSDTAPSLQTGDVGKGGSINLGRAR